MKSSLGKRVLIAGGSAGLGFSIAKALVGRGAQVTALARDRKKLGEAERIGAATIVGHTDDASVMDRVVVEERPDVLILNAGSRLPMGLIDELT